MGLRDDIRAHAENVGDTMLGTTLGKGESRVSTVEHLLSAGRDVVGLDRIPFPPRAVRDFAALPGRFTLIGGSILSSADLSRALTMAPIEAVQLVGAATELSAQAQVLVT